VNGSGDFVFVDNDNLKERSKNDELRKLLKGRFADGRFFKADTRSLKNLLRRGSQNTKSNDSAWRFRTLLGDFPFF
jgi:hypothetical protein